MSDRLGDLGLWSAYALGGIAGIVLLAVCSVWLWRTGAALLVIPILLIAPVVAYVARGTQAAEGMIGWSLLGGLALLFTRFLSNAYEEGAKPLPTATARFRATIPREVKEAVWNRDHGRCVACGCATDLQFDHVIPYSMGGGDTAENLQLLCAPCNRTKGATFRH